MRRALILLLGLAGCLGADGPRITAIEPAAASAGERVVITGERFCGDAVMVGADGACDPPPVGYISFGIDPQIDGSPVSWRDERIEVVVPNAVAPGDVLVVLTVDGRSSNGVSFEVQ